MPDKDLRPLLTPLRISIALHALLLAVLIYLIPEPSAPEPPAPMTFRFVGDVDPEPDALPVTESAALPEPVDNLELPSFDVLLPPLAVEEDVLPPEADEAGPRPPPAAIHIPRGARRQPKVPAPVTAPAPRAQPRAQPRPKPRAGGLPRVVRRPGTLRGFYPRSAQARGIEGTAHVLVQVDAAGQVISARVHKSSGNADLDAAAVRVARLYEFAPSAPGRVLLPVPFRLRD